MTNAEDLIGRQIGQYKVTFHLATGGMAEVYRAQDLSLQRPVALKILKAHLADNEELAERFRREAQAVARLSHPHIVQVYTIGAAEDKRPYMAMQYIEGETLAQRLQRPALMPVVEALQIARQVADALGAAHGAGIIHRDVKPGNILLRRDGVPFLADLGVAAVPNQDRLTQANAFIGTPRYAAPEQAQAADVDARADIYALGVVLYEMLAGRPPFVGDDTAALYQQHLLTPPPPVGQLRPGLSPQTEAVVHRCLEKEPAQRWFTAAELATALDAALQAEGGKEYGAGWPAAPAPVYDPPLFGGTPTPVVAGQKQRRWLYAAAAALGVLLLCSLLAWGGVAWLRQPAGQRFLLALAGAPPVEETAPLPTSTPAPDTATPVLLIATSTLAPPTPTATPTPTMTSTATAVPGPERLVIGRSVLGQPIETMRFGAGPNTIILVGGLHAGMSPGSVDLAQRLVEHLTTHPEMAPEAVTLYIVLSLNPDSQPAMGNINGRFNANGVDLNRNWDCRWQRHARVLGRDVPDSGGPAPFSEPEVQSLVNLIRETNPAAVIFWQARASLGLASPGACADRSLVSMPLAQRYGLAAGYQVADFESLTNQEVPGDGTNWLDSQGIPAIAVLLPEYDDPDWENNLAGITAVLASYRD